MWGDSCVKVLEKMKQLRKQQKVTGSMMSREKLSRECHKNGDYEWLKCKKWTVRKNQ